MCDPVTTLAVTVALTQAMAPDIPEPPKITPGARLPEPTVDEDPLKVAENQEAKAQSRRGARLGTSTLRIPSRTTGLNQYYGPSSGGTGMNV